MKNIYLTPEEEQEAIEWAEDTSWVEREDYNMDLEYLACVKDILDHKVFQSMDG